MNSDFHYSDGRCHVYRRRGERFTDQCVYKSDRFADGSVMVWAGICHDCRTQLKILQGTLNVVKYRDDIIDPDVQPFCKCETLSTSFNMTIQDVTWFVFAKNLWTRITSVFFLFCRDYHICHQLNIYWVNSVDVFDTVKLHWKHYRSWMTHLCTIEAISHKHLSKDWLVLCVGDAVLQEVVTHVTELRKPP